jgi:hypothetical protein
VTTTATAADETRTGADAINALSTSTNSRSLDAELRIFRDARNELRALTEQVDNAQVYLVARLQDEAFRNTRQVDGQSFTVVESVTRSIDTNRAMVVIKKLRLYKRMTKVVVDEMAVKAMADTGLFPDLKAVITETPKRPYIAIS